MAFGRSEEEARSLKMWEAVFVVNGRSRIFRTQALSPAEAMERLEKEARQIHIGKWEDEENQRFDPDGDLAVFDFAVLREFPLKHYGIAVEMKKWDGTTLCKSKPSPVGMAVFCREAVTCPDCLEIMRQIDCSQKN